MKYDNHVHVEDLESATKMARSLGLSGLVVLHKWKPGMKFQNKKRNGIYIISGAEIRGNTDDIRRIVSKIRQSVDFIAVRGGDLEVNRTSVENPLVDVLMQPWGGPIEGLRTDPGINHIMAKLARRNNVAIDFSLSDVIKSYKKTRIQLFANMTKAAKLVKKYKTPFTISSGAFSEWDLRSGSDLKSFGRLLGFEDSQIKKSISDVIVRENRKRRSSRWIQPGVEIA